MNETKPYFHAEQGFYYEAVGDAVDDQDDVQAASIEVPKAPSSNHKWNGSEWVYQAPVIAPELVKLEAARRILAVAPEWKQRNLTAQAAQLAAKGRENWTEEERAAWAAGEALWQHIAKIRAASDLIEADTPINPNFENDERWPEWA